MLSPYYPDAVKNFGLKKEKIMEKDEARKRERREEKGRRLGGGEEFPSVFVGLVTT